MPQNDCNKSGTGVDGHEERYDIVDRGAFCEEDGGELHSCSAPRKRLTMKVMGHEADARVAVEPIQVWERTDEAPKGSDIRKRDAAELEASD